MNGRSSEGEVQKNDGPAYWPQLKWMKRPSKDPVLSNASVSNNFE